MSKACNCFLLCAQSECKGTREKLYTGKEKKKIPASFVKSCAATTII